VGPKPTFSFFSSLGYTHDACMLLFLSWAGPSFFFFLFSWVVAHLLFLSLFWAAAHLFFLFFLLFFLFIIIFLHTLTLFPFFLFFQMTSSSSQSAAIAPLPPLDMDWIAESSGQGQKGRDLYFPETEVKHRSQSGGKGVLKFAILSRSTEDSTVNLIEGMDQSFLRTVTVPTDVEDSSSRSSLPIPSFCGTEDYIPHPEIARRIKAKRCRWGSALVARGEISYLRGFWE